MNQQRRRIPSCPVLSSLQMHLLVCRRSGGQGLPPKVTSFSVFIMQIGQVPKLCPFPSRSALWFSHRLAVTGDSPQLTAGHWPSRKQLVVFPEPWATGHLQRQPSYHSTRLAHLVRGLCQDKWGRQSGEQPQGSGSAHTRTRTHTHTPHCHSLVWITFLDNWRELEPWWPKAQHP